MAAAGGAVEHVKRRTRCAWQGDGPGCIIEINQQSGDDKAATIDGNKAKLIHKFGEAPPKKPVQERGRKAKEGYKFQYDASSKPKASSGTGGSIEGKGGFSIGLQLPDSDSEDDDKTNYLYVDYTGDVPEGVEYEEVLDPSNRPVTGEADEADEADELIKQIEDHLPITLEDES